MSEFEPGEEIPEAGEAMEMMPTVGEEEEEKDSRESIALAMMTGTMKRSASKLAAPGTNINGDPKESAEDAQTPDGAALTRANTGRRMRVRRSTVMQAPKKKSDYVVPWRHNFPWATPAVIEHAVALTSTQFCTICSDKTIQIWRVPESCYSLDFGSSEFQRPHEIEAPWKTHAAAATPTVVSLNESRFVTHSHGPLQIWEVPGPNRDLKAPIEVGHHGLNGKVSYEHTFGMKKSVTTGRAHLMPWEPYDDETCAAIDKAFLEDPDGKYKLPGSPFELRFGKSAVSQKLPVLPPWAPPGPAIIQVNTKSGNTRVVRRRAGDKIDVLVLNEESFMTLGTVDGTMKFWKTPAIRTWEIETPLEAMNPRAELNPDNTHTTYKAVRLSDRKFVIVGKDGSVQIFATPKHGSKQLGEPLLIPPPTDLHWTSTEETAFPVDIIDLNDQQFIQCNHYNGSLYLWNLTQEGRELDSPIVVKKALSHAETGVTSKRHRSRSRGRESLPPGTVPARGPGSPGKSPRTLGRPSSFSNFVRQMRTDSPTSVPRGSVSGPEEKTGEHMVPEAAPDLSSEADGSRRIGGKMKRRVSTPMFARSTTLEMQADEKYDVTTLNKQHFALIWTAKKENETFLSIYFVPAPKSDDEGSHGGASGDEKEQGEVDKKEGEEAEEPNSPLNSMFKRNNTGVGAADLGAVVQHVVSNQRAASIRRGLLNRVNTARHNMRYHPKTLATFQVAPGSYVVSLSETRFATTCGDGHMQVWTLPSSGEVQLPMVLTNRVGRRGRLVKLPRARGNIITHTRTNVSVVDPDNIFIKHAYNLFDKGIDVVAVEDITAKFVEEAGPNLMGRWLEACLQLFMPENHGSGIFMLSANTLALAITAAEELIVDQKDRARQQAMLDGVVATLNRLKDDHGLLAGIAETPYDAKAMATVASTALFRCLITLKHRKGPYLVFYVELSVSVALVVCLYGLCFARAHPARIGEMSVDPDTLEVMSIFFAALLTLREIVQMLTAREFELKHRMKIGMFHGYVRWYREVCTFVILLIVAIVGAPFFLISGPKRTRELWAPGEGWIHENIVLSVHHDPRTFIGFPKAWRGDYWNAVDVVTIVALWALITRSGANNDRVLVGSYLNLVSLTILLLFAKCSKFFLEIGLKFAAFVSMLSKLVKDIFQFMVVFFYVMFAFASVMFIRHANESNEEYGDDDHNPFKTITLTFVSLYDLIFGFELPSGFQVLDPFDQVLIMVFLFMVVIVMLNVLIAIVSDSYAEAMATAFETYWMARLDLVSEIATTFHVPKWIKEHFKKYHEHLLDSMAISELVRREYLGPDAHFGVHDDIGERVKKHIRGESARMRAIVEHQTTLIEELQRSMTEQQRQNEEIKRVLKTRAVGQHHVPLRSPGRK